MCLFYIYMEENMTGPELTGAMEHQIAIFGPYEKFIENTAKKG